MLNLQKAFQESEIDTGDYSNVWFDRYNELEPYEKDEVCVLIARFGKRLDEALHIVKSAATSFEFHTIGRFEKLDDENCYCWTPAKGWDIYYLKEI